MMRKSAWKQYENRQLPVFLSFMVEKFFCKLQKLTNFIEGYLLTLKN